MVGRWRGRTLTSVCVLSGVEGGCSVEVYHVRVGVVWRCIVWGWV